MSITNSYLVPTTHLDGERSLILQLNKKGKKVSAIGGRLTKRESIEDCIERKFNKVNIKKLSFRKIMKVSKDQIEKVTDDRTTALFAPLKGKTAKKILRNKSGKRKKVQPRFISIKEGAIRDQLSESPEKMKINGLPVRISVAKILHSAISKNSIPKKVLPIVVEKEVINFVGQARIPNMLSPPIAQPDFVYPDGIEPSAPPLEVNCFDLLGG